ncbi:UDP-N-acetylmuramoyl-tripeptide--D-alanyl-D-alanine ligase [Anaerosolibacter sp.]|uniref:UDP-N-acetylmuramoyl-tripeptide--D-alanyl-D- alanine ligase n=1 Tax=Anaerosolibacter sp. TaxID=1872527 RepID=UPI0039F104A7
MIALAVREIVLATNGELIFGDPETFIQGIAIDSRKVKKGELFIPLIGEHFDGHSFIGDVLRHGAGGVLCARSKYESVEMDENQCVVLVDDTLKAMQSLAKYYLSKFEIPVIGVTGSTGKTSTKDMIYAVLSQRYKVLRNQGNFNNHIGLPLTIFDLENHHELAVLEMGMSGLGEISLLAELVRPTIAAITNIGLSHIEHLGSQENIMKAKMEITNYFHKGSRLIVNGDDEHLGTLQHKEFHFDIIYIGVHGRYNYIAENIQDLGEYGSQFDLSIGSHKYTFKLKVPGKHNIYNALIAIVIGIEMNVDIRLIQGALEEFGGSKMRLNIFSTSEGIKIINDAYNASPDSMMSAISVLDKMIANRKIACLGDMLEMGEYTERGHYQVGAEIMNGHKLDMLIAVGNSARYIAAGAKEHGFDQKYIFICKDNHGAIEILKEILKCGDAVLVKGSRGMKMEEIVEYIQERS